MENYQIAVIGSWAVAVVMWMSRQVAGWACVVMTGFALYLSLR